MNVYCEIYCEEREREVVFSLVVNVKIHHIDHTHSSPINKIVKPFSRQTVQKLILILADKVSRKQMANLLKKEYVALT